MSDTKTAGTTMVTSSRLQHAAAESLISVVITNYNYAEFLRECIESALKQTHKNLEIILIDDDSTDDSKTVYEEYSNRIKIVEHVANLGIVHTRNEALDLANGEYICFLDADDYFNPDYIEKNYAVAKKYAADVVYPNWNGVGYFKYQTDFPEFDLQMLMDQKLHVTSESLIRKPDKVHRFDVDLNHKASEDWDFFIGLALAGKKIKLAEDNFINYRAKKDSRSNKYQALDRMRTEYAILQKWQKLYPKEVDPIRFLWAKLEDYTLKDEERIRAGEIITYNEAHIGNLTNELAERDRSLDSLYNSKTYRAGRLVTAPYRLTKKLFGCDDRHD